jgi:hypothetical protein
VPEVLLLRYPQEEVIRSLISAERTKRNVVLAGFAENPAHDRRKIINSELIVWVLAKKQALIA